MVETRIQDRRAERREETRAEIIAAAWELVRAEGLAGLNLRELAAKVGMRAPSLYSYFDGKHAIYDAMFLQGNRELLTRLAALPDHQDPVEDLRGKAWLFVEFGVEDPARAQLLFMRTIPGFAPSERTYEVAVEIVELSKTLLRRCGIEDECFDLWTAVISGLVWQQISNEPGGTRWTRWVDDVVDMFLARYARSEKRRRTP